MCIGVRGCLMRPRSETTNPRTTAVSAQAPAAIGAHAGMDRPFTRLTFDKYEPVVCVECETSTAFIEDETSIEAYGEVVRALGESSLDAVESKALIAGLGETQSPLGEAV